MDRKPKVFQNIISKKIDNNRTCSVTRSNEAYESADVATKINNIFKSKDYVYKANVVIKLNSGSVEKQIIGKKDDNLLTIDNEIIPIKDILDIYRKN